MFTTEYDFNLPKGLIDQNGTVHKKGTMILAYDGVLNPETITKLETEIESKILDKNLPKMVVKKVFFICIESLQYMFIHGHKDENGAKHNFFILYLTEKSVKMIGANLISNPGIEKLQKHIARINSFTDPVMAPNGRIAFIGKVTGVKGSEAQGVWTNAFNTGGVLELALQTGKQVPDRAAGVLLNYLLTPVYK